MKQWKKYVGFDQWDQGFAGLESANPGPVENLNLFKGIFLLDKCHALWGEPEHLWP